MDEASAAAADTGSPDEVPPPPQVWGGLGVLARGAGEALAVRGLGALVGFGAHWALAHALTMDEYGAYLHVMGWIGLLALPCTLGYHLGAVRLMAAYDAAGRGALTRGVLRHAGLTTLGVSCAVAALAALVAGLLDPGSHYTVVAIVAGAAILPFASLTAVASGAVRGLRKIAAARAPTVILRPLLVGGTAYLLARGSTSLSAETALLIALGAYAAVAAVTWGIAQREVHRAAGAGPVQTRPRAWRLVALPLLGITVLEMMFGGMSIPVVALVLGEEATAAFGVAARFAAVLVSAELAANAIVGPVVAGAYARRELPGRGADIRLVVRVVFGLTVVAGGVVCLYAEPLLALFGEPYVVGASALRLLVLAAVLAVALGPHGLLLAMTDNTRPLAWVMAFATAVQLLGLLLVLTPYGITGAAVVTCVTSVLRKLPLLFIAQRRLGVRVAIL